MTLERYRLDNPFATKQTESDASVSTYARMVQRGQELIELPRRGGGPDRMGQVGAHVNPIQIPVRKSLG